MLPPKAEDVVDFCNGERPAAGWQMILGRDDVVRFWLMAEPEFLGTNGFLCLQRVKSRQMHHFKPTLTAQIQQIC